MLNIDVGAFSDVGDVKETNQDSILHKAGIVNNRCVSLLIVADGMGGLSFGEEISRLIVTHFNRLWSTDIKELFCKRSINDKDVDNILEKAIIEINSSVISFGKLVNKRVGSTISLLLTIDSRYYIKNVGDSRVYVLKGKQLNQLTQDQSLLADMIRNREITPEDAKNFNKKNVLTMCIGIFEDVKTYSNKGKIRKNDLFVLCCDGLYNCLNESDIVSILLDKKTDLNIRAKTLREIIPKGNARDNVSVVLAQFRKKWFWF